MPACGVLQKSSQFQSLKTEHHITGFETDYFAAHNRDVRFTPHTGHHQTLTGREPHGDWRTYTGESSAHLHQLFNSDGPDDGQKRGGWGFCACDGIEIIYDATKQGLNEDCGVLWGDANGKLEDVSVNHRGGVVIEFNR